jgi:hypothetical protein
MTKTLFDVLDNFDPNNKEDIEVLQELVNNGQIWHLEGYIGRWVADLLEEGILQFPEKRTHDYYGNPIPTREEWEEKKRKEQEKQLHVMKKAKIQAPLMIQKPIKEETPLLGPEVGIIEQMKEEKAKEKENEKRLKA